jgi:hypothetical protein
MSTKTSLFWFSILGDSLLCPFRARSEGRNHDSIKVPLHDGTPAPQFAFLRASIDTAHAPLT